MPLTKPSPAKAGEGKGVSVNGRFGDRKKELE